jgi:hypothetical protein
VKEIEIWEDLADARTSEFNTETQIISNRAYHQEINEFSIEPINRDYRNGILVCPSRGVELFLGGNLYSCFLACDQRESSKCPTGEKSSGEEDRKIQKVELSITKVRRTFENSGSTP